MGFLKFKILDINNHSYDKSETEMLINEDHIVSIKPIKIVLDSEMIKGYWMRLSNGKKYRATEIPMELAQGLTHHVLEIRDDIGNVELCHLEQMQQTSSSSYGELLN